MHLRRASLASAALLLLGCSDGSGPNGPAVGRFQAQLSGTRTAVLSGSSNAGVFFTEDAPDDGHFAIRMFAPRADTLHSMNIDCPGLGPPAPGTYAIGAEPEGCRGGYVRLVSAMSGGTTAPERMSASSGHVTITVSTDGQLVGTFRFEGVLVVDPDTLGPLTAAGTFNAVVE